MEIPQALREAIDQQLPNVQYQQMMTDAQAISVRYRMQDGSGKRLLTKESEAIAYAAARMPATFSAVTTALEQTLSKDGCCPQTLLDAGAGTGAASWAAEGLLELKSITCLERENAMLKTGRAMMEHGSPALSAAKWLQHDLVMDEIIERADLVIAAYVFNELTERDRLTAAKKLWEATSQILLLVEPGTPAAFSHLMAVRRCLLQYGAHIIAPCPHEKDCPKMNGDWCHFTCRVARSRLHRQLKGGEAPFEDEKFTYIALTRRRDLSPGARVLRHPQVRGGHVVLEVCTQDGISNIKLTKKDGERYKQAKKAKSGDII